MMILLVIIISILDEAMKWLSPFRRYTSMRCEILPYADASRRDIDAMIFSVLDEMTRDNIGMA